MLKKPVKRQPGLVKPSKKLVLASLNPGKLAEMQSVVKGYEVYLQSEFFEGQAEETGLSCMENAILKARFAAHRTGLPSIGDDSGLFVDALHGAPGLYSARFAGDNATDQQNVEKLLAVMRDVPEGHRHAKYVCTMAYVRYALDPLPVCVSAEWPGYIFHEQRGDQGYGYDSVFYLFRQNATVAQLMPALKQSLSNRTVALRALLAQID
ncbi:RdgB/HAM1 family non-canonical purine NTP pyrophosphatase [Thiomicrospira sp. R3]|uniref:RdgB/HAM1 family non-canonical purine NTP pyrophosphatase n=1 Tax=Thiomicrospira sp. R3 TaxID=3035472 RepID=UPI00259B38DF|nr:RdgB/HAM1 family non-canonical purine NTP pyrophosphatase [Thiomicrospira sp. R3]WFE69732.1 RdgB/HAM1 family non-canonical purine NTP pyrophosphatase [Thiomicrospira sp. R3]